MLYNSGIERKNEMKLILATDNGSPFVEKLDGNWMIVRRELEGRSLTSIDAQGETILAGSRQGLYRSSDGGRDWRICGDEAKIGHVRWLMFHPQQPWQALVGTEPAALFVSLDGGRSWRERGEVARLRDQFNWFLPYSPEAGCVRGFAIHDRHLFAAVEVGGLLVSNDGGERWQLVDGSDGRPQFGNPPEGNLHPDVHSIAVHPSSADLLYAPTGGGFFVSEDGGRSWEERYPPCYCRAVWVNPDDKDHLVLGVAESVDRMGQIVQTRDGGRSWQPINGALETPWPRTMVERFYQNEKTVLAVLSNGRLLEATIDQWQWNVILPEAGRVRALAFI